MTGVHAAIAIICIQHFAASAPIANGIAFIGATVLSCTLNTIWSFSAQLNSMVFAKFVSVSVVGFLLAIFVAWTAQRLGLSYILGIVSVALTVPPITFVLHHFWTYR